jgi:hypothetical protein
MVAVSPLDCFPGGDTDSAKEPYQEVLIDEIECAPKKRIDDDPNGEGDAGCSGTERTTVRT